MNLWRDPQKGNRRFTIRMIQARRFQYADLLGSDIFLLYITSSIVVVTPLDRPKSVRNRCVIEGFGGIFVLSIGC